MANTTNASKEQIAVCEKVTTKVINNADKDIYTFRLNDGQPFFDVFQSQYLKASVGEHFRPVVFISPSAYTDKKGTPRANMKAFINWEKIQEVK